MPVLPHDYLYPDLQICVSFHKTRSTASFLLSDTILARRFSRSISYGQTVKQLPTYRITQQQHSRMFQGTFVRSFAQMDQNTVNLRNQSVSSIVGIGSPRSLPTCVFPPWTQRGGATLCGHQYRTFNYYFDHSFQQRLTENSHICLFKLALKTLIWPMYSKLCNRYCVRVHITAYCTFHSRQS